MVCWAERVNITVNNLCYVEQVSGSDDGNRSIFTAPIDCSITPKHIHATLTVTKLSHIMLTRLQPVFFFLNQSANQNSLGILGVSRLPQLRFTNETLYIIHEPRHRRKKMYLKGISKQRRSVSNNLLTDRAVLIKER